MPTISCSERVPAWVDARGITSGHRAANGAEGAPVWAPQISRGCPGLAASCLPLTLLLPLENLHPDSYSDERGLAHHITTAGKERQAQRAQFT